MPQGYIKEATYNFQVSTPLESFPTPGIPYGRWGQTKHSALSSIYLDNLYLYIIIPSNEKYQLTLKTKHSLLPGGGLEHPTYDFQRLRHFGIPEPAA